MIRAITMLRVADCYGPMPYSQVKKGNFYVSYDTQEQVYTSILNDLANAADVLYNYYVETNGNAPLGANDPVFDGNYSGWAKFSQFNAFTCCNANQRNMAWHCSRGS